MICPFCGHTQRPGECCQDCGADFAPAARRGLIEAMGPWFLRDSERPFRPGLSYASIVELARLGDIRKYTILRGPTTRQLWTVARHVPGVAHLLGYCHACDGPVNTTDPGCRHCGATFGVDGDRNAMGLPEANASDGVAAERVASRSAGFTPAAGNGAATRDDRTQRPAPVRVEAGAPRERSAGSVSAFATDEELFGSAGSPVGFVAAAAPVTAVASPAPRTIDVATGSPPVPNPAARDAVERSLRGAVKRQRHLITLLGVLLLAAILAALWPIAAGRLARAREAEAGRRGEDGGGTTPPQQRGAEQNGGTVTTGAGAATGASAGTAPGTKPLDAAPGHDPSASVQELTTDIAALEANSSASIESRRERAVEIERRLDRAAAAPGADTAAISALRRRLTAAKAKIELDAVLPEG